MAPVEATSGDGDVGTDPQKPSSHAETMLTASDQADATDDRTVLVIDGEIDVTTGTQLRAALGMAIADPRVRVVIADLTRVDFMSSTGIAVLVDAHAEANHAGKTLQLISGGNRAVLMPLRMSGVADMLHLDEGD